MNAVPTVKTYPSDTPKRDVAFGIAIFIVLIGVPVAFGCLNYVFGETAFRSMLSGAGCGLFSIVLVQLVGRILWGCARWRRGRPLDPGELIEVVSGTLAGQRGTVDAHGQGGPATLYVKMDDSANDELIVFQWRQLRRIEKPPATPAAPPSPSSA